MDEARFLGQRDELKRRDQTAGGMLPTDQRFETHKASLGQLEVGLVVEEELLAVDRERQILLQLQPGESRGVHARIEDHTRVLPRTLRVIHGRVGLAQHVLGPDLARDRARRHPDTRADDGLATLQHQRLTQRATDAVRDSLSVGDVGDLWKQQRELVAGKPRDGVPWSHALEEAR
jgi:hypothetical protein